MKQYNSRFIDFLKSEDLTDILRKVLKVGFVGKERSLLVTEVGSSNTIAIFNNDDALVTTVIDKLMVDTGGSFDEIKKYVQTIQMISIGVFNRGISPSGKYVYSHKLAVEDGDNELDVYIADLNIFNSDERIKEFRQAVSEVKQEIVSN